MLADGEGVVIGGLIQEKEVETQTKIPGLGDLPYIGLLFRKMVYEKQKAEVIVTLVPRIVNGCCGLTPRDEVDVSRSLTPLLEGRCWNTIDHGSPCCPILKRIPRDCIRHYLRQVRRCRRCGGRGCRRCQAIEAFGEDATESVVQPASEEADIDGPSTVEPTVEKIPTDVAVENTVLEGDTSDQNRADPEQHQVEQSGLNISDIPYDVRFFLSL